MAKYRKYNMKALKYGDFLNEIKKMYDGGVIGLQNSNEDMLASNYNGTNIGEPSFGFKTENGPSSPTDLNNSSGGLSKGQYAGMGLALAGGISQYSNADTTAEKNQAIDNTGTGVVSAINPLWGALAKVGTTASTAVAGNETNNNNVVASEVINPFNQFKNNETGGDWAMSFLNPLGSNIMKGKRRVSDKRDAEKQAAIDRGINELSDNTLTNYSGINTMSRGGRLNRRKYAGGGMLTHYPEEALSHSDNPLGGIPVGQESSVEGGETLDNDNSYVISDRIMIDDDMIKEFGFHKRAKGKSLAAYSKMIEKNNPRENDTFDKATRKLMLERVTEANESANMKNFEDDYDNILKKKMGGKLYKMYKGGQLRKPMATGGTFDESDPWNLNRYNTTATPSWGLNSDLPYYNNPADDLPTQDINTGLNTPTRLDSSDLGQGEEYLPRIQPKGMPYGKHKAGYPTLTKTGLETVDPTVVAFEGTSEEAKNAERISNAADYRETTDVNVSPLYDAGRLVPIAANLIAGSKHDTLDKKNYRNKSRISPGRYNINPLLDQNKSDFVQTQGLTKEASSGNAGTYLANLASLYSNKTKANTAAYATKENAETQMDMQAQMANAGIESENKRMDFNVDDWNARSKSGAKNLQMTAAGQVGEFADAKANEAFMEAYINSLSDRYKYNFTHKLKA